MAKKPAPKETSPRVSKIASDILAGRNPKPTKTEINTLAGSVLSQDQTKGQAPKRK